MLDIKNVTYPTPGYLQPRSLSSITDLIIHHTAGSLYQGPLEIDAEHRAIGDAMIAYNWVITNDGQVYNGRPISVDSAASFGRNQVSVSVVLCGNFQSDAPVFTGPPLQAQIDALKQLCLYAHLSISSIIRTYGHRDIAPMFFPDNQGDYSTACPGDLLYAKIPEIKAFILSEHHAKL